MSDTPRTDAVARINEYLGVGGLFNPEILNVQQHEAVRDTLIQARDELAAANERNLNLRTAIAKSQEEITQTCGKALGYPWYKDDQKNFPGSDETDGVCVGEHVAETIVAELADKYAKANERIKRLEKVLQRLVDAPDNRSVDDFSLEELEAWNEARVVLENKR